MEINLCSDGGRPNPVGTAILGISLCRVVDTSRSRTQQIAAYVGWRYSGIAAFRFLP
jgi:hypothetical protein